MKILRYVSFDGPFGGRDPRSFEETGVPEAARLVADALTAHGLSHSAPSNRGDWACDLIVRAPGVTIELIVASTDHDRPFVVSIEGKLGMVASRRGVRRQTLVAAHAAVCAALHAALADDESITKERWWTEQQWEAEAGWTDTP